MKFCYFIFAGSILFIGSSQIFAQGNDESYAALEIPDSLLKNAQAVIRNEETVMTITDDYELKTDETLAITILNESANGLSDLDIYYDSFIKPDFDYADVYDKNGKLIRKV